MKKKKHEPGMDITKEIRELGYMIEHLGNANWLDHQAKSKEDIKKADKVIPGSFDDKSEIRSFLIGICCSLITLNKHIEKLTKS